MDNDLEVESGEIQGSIVAATEQTKQDVVRLAEILKKYQTKVKNMTAAKKRDLTHYRNSLRRAEEDMDKVRNSLEIATRECNMAFQRCMEASQRRFDATRQNDELQTQNVELQAKLDRVTNDVDRFLCSICWERPVDIITCCHHLFCRKCVDEWMRTKDLDNMEFVDHDHVVQVRIFKCPMCRGTTKETEISPLRFRG
jgi:Zinc finger, C3HC4 type (RING finger)